MLDSELEKVCLRAMDEFAIEHDVPLPLNVQKIDRGDHVAFYAFAPNGREFHITAAKERS